MQTIKPPNVDAYINGFSSPQKELMQQLRSIIKELAPEAEEKISYGMPGYMLNGMLVYFAGYEKHIGLYAMPSAVSAFKDELTKFKTSKGTVQLPLDKKLPVTLIKKMIRYRIKENAEKAALKTRTKESWTTALG